ncbi:splicing factor 3A subunit 3-like [Sycon ciliatum]|uniref:splicing factor 3A subunit 3-like n=1 Tax=Sycon ciliatum TaxID=27933 RepID=UPI0020AC17F4|eukprot:scpid73148/ scgid11101/ Splicing factor 3A subunit 3; SF3a60; Spliceosome-associated protein 61
METLLEQQRRYHEERERLEEAMAQEKLLKKPVLKERINSDHRVDQYLRRYQECTDTLHDLYEDNDGLRKKEIAALSGPNELAEFYTRLRHIRDWHRKFPNEVQEPMQYEFLKMKESGEDDSAPVVFTDEEGYGKYLDLHECYRKFINLKFTEKVDYVTYLKNIDRLFDIPKEKKSPEYRRYLEGLLDYLMDYCQRVFPLTDLAAEFERVQVEFEEKWEGGTFQGWQKDAESAMAKQSGAHLDLSAFSSSEELASLGLDRLKSALQALGLKCGGTLDQRAQRLFAAKDNQVDGAAAAATSTKGGRSAAQKQKSLASLEAKVYYLFEVLGEQRLDTCENVERRQARTADELEEDAQAADALDSDDSDDDESTPYNPKNLPLGWDGKPIPYWLYKLHGLNMTYECEICGNFKYRGPKAFQRHFSEWRHAHGMRCLGIPNTAHFANVTSIDDAQKLWNRLKGSKEKLRWMPDADEEFEDSSGNVVNKKTFEDLQRQGLL